MADPPKAFALKANEFLFQLDESDLDATDIVEISPGVYSVIQNNQSVMVKVLPKGADAKLLRVEVNGEPFDIQIKDSLDQQLDTLGFNKISGKKVNTVKAPMPGLVIDVAVSEGQELKEGERLLILEAMKMENSILMPNDGQVKRVLVKPGQAVEKGQVLVELA
jgi:biotin carboxyl carrier protein